MQNNLHIDKTVRTNSLPFPWQAFMELGKESKELELMKSGTGQFNFDNKIARFSAFCKNSKI